MTYSQLIEYCQTGDLHSLFKHQHEIYRNAWDSFRYEDLIKESIVHKQMNVYRYLLFKYKPECKLDKIFPMLSVVENVFKICISNNMLKYSFICFANCGLYFLPQMILDYQKQNLNTFKSTSLLLCEFQHRKIQCKNFNVSQDPLFDPHLMYVVLDFVIE